MSDHIIIKNNYIEIIFLILFIILLSLFIYCLFVNPAPFAMKNIPEKFRPTKDSNNIISVNKLMSISNYTKTNNKLLVTDKPIYLSKGLYVLIDEDLTKIENNDITNEINNNNNENEEGKIDTLQNTISVIDKVTNFLEISQDLKKSSQHYIDLITNFLSDNPDASKKWKDCLDYLGYFIQKINGKDGELPKLPEVPDINEIYDYLKFAITKVGGMSAILKRFQKRIKWDMIQGITENKASDGTPYRIVTNEVESKGSGKCTVYPLSWWQNCPNGQTPSGSRGWGENNACNKWYQYLSGELLCSEYKTNSDYPIQGNCEKIIEILDTLQSESVQKMISISVTAILSTLSLIPQLAGTLKTIQAIFKLTLPLVSGDYTWLINDLKDVCYNYTCEGNTKTNVCGNTPDTPGGEKKYCIPHVDDETLANRDCLVNQDCNTKPSGCCVDDSRKNDNTCLNNDKILLLKSDKSNFNNTLLKFSDYI